MSTIYLKDGRIADLITKTDKGYLVDPYITFRYYADNEESAPSGEVEIVQEIFETAPVDLIEKECQKVYDRIDILTVERDKLQLEKNNLFNEVDSLKREKTNLSKLIFNRSDIKNAKRIIVFSKDKIAPVIYDPPNRYKLSLSIELTDYNPQIRAWSYRFYNDDRYGNGEYFDEKYGVRCDLTDEEVMVLNFERLASEKFDDWTIERTDDKWLTPELIEKKKTLVANRKTRERATKEGELLKIKEWLEQNP